MIGYAQRLVVITRGLGGIHSETADGASITHYDRRLRPYYGELIEGGYVIDYREVLDERPMLAVRAPMVSGKLPLGAVDRLDANAARGSLVLRAIAGEPENPASGLATLMIAAPDCGAFDSVAPDVYAAWWRPHGARIGQRRGDRIEWEDGTTEDIRPFDRRYLGADGRPEYSE